MFFQHLLTNRTNSQVRNQDAVEMFGSPNAPLRFVVGHCGPPWPPGGVKEAPNICHPTKLVGGSGVCHNHLKQPQKIGETLTSPRDNNTCQSLGLDFLNKVLMVDPVADPIGRGEHYTISETTTFFGRCSLRLVLYLFGFLSETHHATMLICNGNFIQLVPKGSTQTSQAPALKKRANRS